MWWIKKFRKRKMQSLLIFIVVAMCVILIAGSAVILTSLTSVYEKLAKETDAVDVKIYTHENFSDKDYETEFKKLNCVKKVKPIYANRYISLLYKDKEQDVFMDLCKYDEEIYGKIRILSGSIDNLDKRSCILPQATARLIGIKLGDTIKVRISDTTYEYTVVATYAEIFSCATEYTCDLLVTDIPQKIEKPNIYAVHLKSGYDCDDMIAEYTKQNNGILDGTFRSCKDSIMNAELTELILGGILLGISSVVFLAVLLILGYIVKNCFESDKKTIAIYKTIGYHTGQIRRLYVTFYMSIIFSASIIGGLISPLLSSSFISEVYANIGEEGRISAGSQIVICILIINIISVSMLLFQTKRVSKMKPVEILNGSDEGIGKKKIKESKRNRYSFSPCAMAIRMIIRDKKNTILLAITCVLSFYIVNLSVVCLQNIDMIKGDMNYYWLGIDKHDITIENSGTNEEFYKICDEIKQDSQVKKIVKKNYDLSIAIPYHQTTNAMIYETFEDLKIPVLRGRNPKNSNEVVVGNIYLKELGIDIGDYLTIQLDENHRVDLLVVGTYQGFYNLGRGIKVMGSLLTENDVKFNYTQCSVNLKNDVNKTEFIERMKNKYGEKIKVIDRKKLYSSIMDVICKPQREALLPFVVITILIGASNAFYIVYTSNITKRKRYTIYKSIGYTSSHLLKMNCIYVLFVAITAIAIAIPAFIYLFPKIMIMSMSMFGFAEYKLVIKPLTLLITNLAVLLIFMITSCFAVTDLFKNHISKIINE